MVLFKTPDDGECWVDPARRRRRRKDTPYKQKKAARDLILLGVSQSYKLSPRELSDVLNIPISTVRDALRSAKEAGKRHKASRPRPDDEE